MEEFIKRIIIERQELKERIDKLRSFVLSPRLNSLSDEDARLLQLQEEVMTTYKHILDFRLNRLLPENSKENE